jgi:hypothetical protein
VTYFNLSYFTVSCVSLQFSACVFFLANVQQRRSCATGFWPDREHL